MKKTEEPEPYHQMEESTEEIVYVHIWPLKPSDNEGSVGELEDDKTVNKNVPEFLGAKQPEVLVIDIKTLASFLIPSKRIQTEEYLTNQRF